MTIKAGDLVMVTSPTTWRKLVCIPTNYLATSDFPGLPYLGYCPSDLNAATGLYSSRRGIRGCDGTSIE